MRVTVKKAYPVFSWSWDTDSVARDVHCNNPEHNVRPDINSETYAFLRNYRNDEDDVCGICRVSYNGVCPNCKIPGRSCPLVVGSCNHSFHFHCIYRWLDTPTSKGLCPMCRQEFTLKPEVLINEPHAQKFMELISRNRERRLAMEREEQELNNELREGGVVVDEPDQGVPVMQPELGSEEEEDEIDYDSNDGMVM